jgi:hypothetical protein
MVTMGTLALICSTQAASAQCHSKGYGGGGYSSGYGYVKQYRVYQPRVPYGHWKVQNYGYAAQPQFHPQFQPQFQPGFGGFNQQPGPFSQGAGPVAPNGALNNPAPLPLNPGVPNQAPIPSPGEPPVPQIGNGDSVGAVTPLGSNSSSVPKINPGQGVNTTSQPIIR